MTWLLNAIMDKHKRWMVLGAVLAFWLFGMWAGASWFGGKVSPTDAETIAAAESLGYVHGDAVRKIETTLLDRHAEDLTAAQVLAKAELEAALEANTATVTAQIHGELGWAPAVVRRQKGEMAAMRDTLDACEGRPPTEVVRVVEGEPVVRWRTREAEAGPCVPGTVDVDGSCDIETIEIGSAGPVVGMMMAVMVRETSPPHCDPELDANCQVIWDATRPPEQVQDVTFNYVPMKAPKWGWWSHIGIDRKQDSTLFDGVAGVQSPEYLLLSQDRYGVAVGGTLHRTKHGATVTATVNPDGLESVRAFWSFRGVPFVGD